MNESERELQKRIYMAQDIAAARDVLNASYQRERGELTATGDKFRGFVTNLVALKASLDAADGTAGSYGAARKALQQTGNLAGFGNENSLTALPGVVNTFLAAAKNNAATSLDYRREVALARGFVDKAIAGASGMASAADMQLAAIGESVMGLLKIDNSVVTVHDAIAALETLLAAPTLSIADETAKARADAKQAATDQKDATQALAADVRTGLAELKVEAAKTSSLLNTVTRGGRGMPVFTASGEVVAVDQIA